VSVDRKEVDQLALVYWDILILHQTADQNAYSGKNDYYQTSSQSLDLDFHSVNFMQNLLDLMID